jgi:uncharacterized protein (DUF2336 family)
MGLMLTKDDVLELMSKNSTTAKVVVTQKICREYCESIYSPEEIKIAEQIFRMLAKDAEIVIRQTLSESLKLSSDLPNDIALQLANDVIEVAVPMLEYSDVLSDEDLAGIIENKEVQKLVAISRRNKLSQALITNLLGTGHPDVVNKVLGRKDFVQTDSDFANLIDTFASDENTIKRIIQGTRIAAPVIEKMMQHSAANIMSELKVKYHIVPQKVDTYVSHTLEVSTLSVIDHHSSNAEIDYLVNHLANYNRLTPSLILSALCMGKRRFFIAAMAKRSGIPKENATALVQQGGKKGLETLLDKAGIPNKLFTAIEIVYSLAEEKKSQQRNISVRDFCTWLVTKLEYFAERKQIEYLNYMLAITKQTQQMRPTAI